MVVGFGVGFGFLVLVGFGVGDVLLVLLGVALGDVLLVLLGFAVGLADALPELLGEPAGLSAESRRMAAFGRLEQVPFTIGELWPRRLPAVAPKAAELDARRMNPVSAVSATGLTSCALTGTTSPSWTSSLKCSCPPWSSQYACPD